MAGGLDMSLEDIIKSNRKPTGSRGRGVGGNSTGGARGGFSGSGSNSGPSRRFSNRVGNRTPYSRVSDTPLIIPSTSELKLSDGPTRHRLGMLAKTCKFIRPLRVSPPQTAVTKSNVHTRPAKSCGYADQPADIVDIISAIEFDHSGDHLATGDRGGKSNGARRDLEEIDYPMRHPEFCYKTDFQSHDPKVKVAEQDKKNSNSSSA